MPIANNKSRVECSGADRCTFAAPRTALFCHPRCKPSQRHKTAQKIASIYEGCYGVTGVTVFFEFVKTGEMATATSKVVTNGPQVVPNSLEVVPNGIEVVPMDGKFFHPLKKTNDITAAWHDVTTSNRHLGAVDCGECRMDIPRLDFAVSGIRERKLAFYLWQSDNPHVY